LNRASQAKSSGRQELVEEDPQQELILAAISVKERRRQAGVFTHRALDMHVNASVSAKRVW